jgi:hypothetical protein
MDDEYIFRWGARVFLLLIFLLFLWWLFKNKTKYDFKGLDYIPKGPSFLNNLFGIKVSTKSKKRENKTEEQCRRILQKIFNKPFPTIRPNFLCNPVTKKNLELDCYNSELNIALEYNGQQHYTYTPHFHRTKKNFYSQVHRDDWKRKKCRELGIILIEVPYWITPDRLEGYIIDQLRKKGCSPI